MHMSTPSNLQVHQSDQTITIIVLAVSEAATLMVVVSIIGAIIGIRCCRNSKLSKKKKYLINIQ